MNKIEKIKELKDSLKNFPGGGNSNRYAKIIDAIKNLENGDWERARIVQCTDEYSGRRFGDAMCRTGRCTKIGSGGRNKGQQAYQLWLDWS